MRAESIVDHEADFDNRGIDSHGIYHSLSRKRIQIPGEADYVDYVRVKPMSKDESYFYKARHEKDQIVLHYTMGYLKGDIATLTTLDYHVSVPFIIGRNGTIYNLFFSGFWAYHLGPGAVGGNQIRSRASIGIELSNIGPLRSVDEGLVTYYSDTDVYCMQSQNEFYREASYRRFKHYATFSDAQYDALIRLLRYLTARYNIRREFLPLPERFEARSEVAEFNGIVSHVNYRRSGKEDIGPAFDWDRVIAGVRA